MKTKCKRLLLFILCLTLCMGNVLTVGAVGETNTSGVTFSAVLDTDTIQVSDSDQTVVMHIKAGTGVTVDGIGFTVTKDSPLAIAGITGGDKIGAYDATATNTATGKAAWGSSDSENVTDVTELAVITFTVPANTPAGTYTVGFEDLELTKDYGTIWEDSASATATLTVTETATTEGYTAGISADNVTVENGNKVSIKVTAGHTDSTKEVFNADEIELSYDKSKLAFNKDASALDNAQITDDATNGKLKIVKYGDNRNFGDIYTLVFDTIAIGTAAVTLDSAGFIDKAGASQSDLLAASINPGTVNLTINEAQFGVTLPPELEGIIEGATTVVAGSSYEFKVLDTNYEYEFNATMGGTTELVTTTDGVTFTVDQVTADLTIAFVKKTPKSYGVTFSGTGAADVKAEDGTTAAGNTATYASDYTFKINAAAGYGYQVSMTINGEAYAGYTVSTEGNVYTIPGAAITGAVVITVERSASDATVTVTGEGAGIAAGYTPTATIGSSYTLTVVPEAGYIYTVTATMGGNAIELTANAEKTTYTTPAVTRNIVFTIARTVDKTGVTVYNKLTINTQSVYAVSYTTKLADNKVPTYNESPMYWSENHQAYIYLTIAGSLSEDEAKAEINIADGTPVIVQNDSDVNGTDGNVDASDAQYVWNMYKAEYSEFTDDVTMTDFIKADRNKDYKIDMSDATWIVNEILGNSNATE